MLVLDLLPFLGLDLSPMARPGTERRSEGHAMEPHQILLYLPKDMVSGMRTLQTDGKEGELQARHVIRRQTRILESDRLKYTSRPHYTRCPSFLQDCLSVRCSEEHHTKAARKSPTSSTRRLARVNAPKCGAEAMLARKRRCRFLKGTKVTRSIPLLQFPTEIRLRILRKLLWQESPLHVEFEG
jgi:hypothetical protein